MRTLANLACALLLIGSAGLTDAQSEPDYAVGVDLYDTLTWRHIGPYRGGRATTIEGVPSQPGVYYTGTTGGGVWKTTNAGNTWFNISDSDFNVGSIGAVAVSLSDPNVVYAGTGESPIRGVTTSHGDGVYKSTDAGRSWQHIGLTATRQISKIQIHPTNPEHVLVAAQGNPWGPNDERGVYRSTDGGRSWELTLSVDGTTGAADLSMDPNNPRIVYAAMWDHQRNPWFIRSGGPGGGIYKSTNGGGTWEKLGGGLPDLIGKVGISVSAANSLRVYAIVEAEEGGLFRSDDAGESWQRVNSDRIVQARAWYYNHITADPVDAETVYILNVPLLKSVDGGATFSSISTPHGDYHDHWIHPTDNRVMANANDGGATITLDGGKTWTREDTQPTAQFYRVTTDNLFPYTVYGGQQDNTTVAIASRSFSGGIGREDFHPVGGGESAHIVFDPENPRLIYATTINSTLTEYDAKTQRTRPIKPYPEYVFGRDSKDHRYRANWNAPLAISPHDPTVIYYGTQVVLKSSDRGVTWSEISPDLTRNEPEKQGKNGGPITNEQAGAEFYNTIFYLVESQHEAGTIWVGSDDGLVHLTRDGGANWNNVTPRGLPEAQINAIEISPHDPATAYIAVAGYKLNDFTPTIYVTTDYGKRWRKKINGLPEDTFVRVVREDPLRAGLLYAGTEAGMWVSFDGADHWQPLGLDLPPVPITDLTLRQGDLIAATQGRGFWILDKPAVLRQIDEQTDSRDFHLFEPAPALRINGGGNGSSFTPQAGNPVSGAPIYYYLKDELEEGSPPVKIEILDSAGSVVRTVVAEDNQRNQCMARNADPRSPIKPSIHSPKAGLNRWVWDFRSDGFECIENMLVFAGYHGTRSMPGTYQVRLTVNGDSQTMPLTLSPDPRLDAAEADYSALAAHLEQTANMMSVLISRLDRIRQADSQIRTLAELTQDNGRHGEIASAADQIHEKVQTWVEQVIQPRHETFEDDINWPNMLDVQIMHLLRSSDAGDPPLTEGALQRQADLAAQWSALEKTYQHITQKDIVAFNELLSAAGISPVVLPSASP